MRLSACLIVKNEQDLLPQCLESIKDVDEIIVVDTGSEDNTVEIAKSFGARIFHHAWENDFSLHRNQSLRYASGDWILIIDADEVMKSPISTIKSRLHKVDPHVSALVVKVRECGDKTSWLGVRFFRRSANPRYHGIVHNKVRYGGVCAATDIEMEHYGYSLSPAKMRMKRARTEKLLHERIKRDPGDHAAFYYLTQLKIGEKNFNKALAYGQKFFETVPVGPHDFQFYSVMYFYMAFGYLNNGDGNKSADWALKGLEFYPNDIDLNYIMSRIGYQSKRKDWAVTHGQRYLDALAAKERKPEPGAFVSEVDLDNFNNRTIYTEHSKQDVEAFMGGAYD